MENVRPKCSFSVYSLFDDFFVNVVFRSPWSNVYFPPLEDGVLPSPALRALEIEANEIFALYRDQ